jgi:hypothetical protein
VMLYYKSNGRKTINIKKMEEPPSADPEPAEPTLQTTSTTE